MSDLVERLRQAAWKNPHSDAGKRQSEAADRIEALTAENAALKEAGRKAVDHADNMADCALAANDRIEALEAALREADPHSCYLEATDDRAK